jgi:high-affinity nickel-transport protein
LAGTGSERHLDTSLLAILALGFFLGMRHATDPDHVIAVTTIVTRQRSTRSAAVIGAAWGVGHTLTILIVGGGIILFSWVIPPRVGLSMEFSVGVMLIILGLMNLSGLLHWVRDRFAGTGPVHSHAHSHGDYVHNHPHAHEPEFHPHPPEQTPVAWLDRHVGGLALYQLMRPLVVGIVHGLAGSAAVALLVLTTIRNPRWSLFYLVIFGIGTVVGMMLITAAIALPFAHQRKAHRSLDHRLRLASGLVSLGFGCYLAYRIGVVDGLFSGTPQWNPR